MGIHQNKSRWAFWWSGLDLDVRSLAAFRIAIGLMLLFQSAWQWPVLSLFYSGEGILPLKVLFELPERNAYVWSWFFVSEEVWFIVGLGVLQGLAAVGLTLGWRTRWMTGLCWMLYASAAARAPYAGSGSVLMVKVLLFWAMFLPLGSRWSLDARAGRFVRIGVGVRDMPAMGMVLQYCFIYWFTAWLKSDPMWTKEFTALNYALLLDDFARPLGQWVLQFPGVLKVMTVSTLVIEFGAPFLVIAPFCRGWLRLAGVVLLMGLHAGIMAVMSLTIFALVGIISGVALLPTCFWNWVEMKFGMRGVDLSEDLPRHEPRGMVMWARDGVLAILLLMVLASNLVSKDEDRWGWLVSEPVLSALQITHLKQEWPLFAPRPYGSTGWTMVEARAADGRRYNLVTGQRLRGRNSAAKPGDRADGSTLNAMSHWSIPSYKILKAPPAVKKALVACYVKRWNDREGPERAVTDAQLVRVQFRNHVDGTRGPVQVITLWSASEEVSGSGAAGLAATAEGEAEKGKSEQ